MWKVVNILVSKVITFVNFTYSESNPPTCYSVYIMPSINIHGSSRDVKLYCNDRDASLIAFPDTDFNRYSLMFYIFYRP